MTGRDLRRNEASTGSARKGSGSLSRKPGGAHSDGGEDGIPGEDDQQDVAHAGSEEAAISKAEKAILRRAQIIRQAPPPSSQYREVDPPSSKIMKKLQTLSTTSPKMKTRVVPQFTGRKCRQLVTMRPDGRAEIAGANGGRYIGEVLAGRPNGHGEYWVPGLSPAEPPRLLYVGTWVEGKKEGNGIFHYKNGEVYSGGVFNNERHGHGAMLYTNLDVYSGNWDKGVKTGDGSICYKNGDIFIGHFHKDRKDGLGVYYSLARRRKQSGEWVAGAPATCSVTEISPAELRKLRERRAELLSDLPRDVCERHPGAGGGEPPLSPRTGPLSPGSTIHLGPRVDGARRGEGGGEDGGEGGMAGEPPLVGGEGEDGGEQPGHWGDGSGEQHEGPLDGEGVDGGEGVTPGGGEGGEVQEYVGGEGDGADYGDEEEEEDLGVPRLPALDLAQPYSVMYHEVAHLRKGRTSPTKQGPKAKQAMKVQPGTLKDSELARLKHAFEILSGSGGSDATINVSYLKDLCVLADLNVVSEEVPQLVGKLKDNDRGGGMLTLEDFLKVLIWFRSR
eukprot:jgi/Mesvir1/28226/Mv04775-RA.1